MRSNRLVIAALLVTCGLLLSNVVATVFWEKERATGDFPPQFAGIQKGLLGTIPITIHDLDMTLSGIALPLPLSQALSQCCEGGNILLSEDETIGHAVRPNGSVAWVGYWANNTTYLFCAELPDGEGLVGMPENQGMAVSGYQALAFETQGQAREWLADKKSHFSGLGSIDGRSIGSYVRSNDGSVVVVVK